MLRIAVNGKAKRWVCDPNPFLSLAGVVLPTIPTSQGYKYLGVTISARERDSTPEELLRRGMNHLTVAPLKPQQRLLFLCVHLLPKLRHRLVLTRSRGGVLRQLDKLVRRGVRQWLRLPHDATNAYIHAEIKDGGLGVPSLRATILFMKRDTLEHLASSADTMILHMVAMSGTFRKECVNCSRPPVRVGSTVVTSRDDARRVTAEQLYASADGYGLAASATVPFVHSWVADGTALMTGGAFIHAVQIMGVTVSTRRRSARGRQHASDKCDACRREETLGHILQVCHRTWGHRIKRHDTVLEKLLHELERRGWSVLRAPVIPLRGGSPQIPDGVADKDGYCWIVDASLVADNADFDDAHMSKCTKYDTLAFRDWCQFNWPSSVTSGAIRFGALVFNRRGMMSSCSAHMCQQIGITQNHLKLMACCVVEWGWRIYRMFSHSTACWSWGLLFT